jgi:hypothetical protein
MSPGVAVWCVPKVFCTGGGAKASPKWAIQCHVAYPNASDLRTAKMNPE